MTKEQVTNKANFVGDATADASLGDVNGSVEVPTNGSFLRKLLAFSGPGALVAVGYMDPGNWVTSVAGGANYHYTLLSVVLVSSLIAMMLQYMAGKLGMVKGEDLAQATRARTNKAGGFALWIITELALIATDIAEVIGGAIALHLLFGWSMIASVLTTAFDVILLLLLMKFGFRKIEAIVITLILTILIIFGYLVISSDPNIVAMLGGYLPKLQVVSTSAPAGVDSPTIPNVISNGESNVGGWSALVVSNRRCRPSCRGRGWGRRVALTIRRCGIRRRRSRCIRFRCSSIRPWQCS